MDDHASVHIFRVSPVCVLRVSTQTWIFQSTILRDKYHRKIDANQQDEIELIFNE